MANIRVCMFASELVPTPNGVYIGGAVSSAANLCRSLPDEVEIHVVTTLPRDWQKERSIPSPEWGSISTYDGVSQHPGIIDGTFSFIEGCRELIRECRTNEIDIIHSHSGYSVLASIAVTAGRVLDTPVIHSLYCPVPQSFDGVEERLSSPSFTRLYFRGVDHVFAMSKNVHQSLHNIGVNDISELPPIIDEETFHPKCPKPDSVVVDEDKFTILFVGSLKPEKGLEYLIDAVGNLCDEIPIQLIYTTERSFPGEEERRELVNRKIAENDLGNEVTTIGIINDMENLIANADVLAVPFTSTSGPSDFPIVILEAMACNTPVVATDIGGIPELLDEERGHLVPPRDADALSDALASVYRSNSAVSTRSFITSRFNSETVADQVVAEYRSYQ